jgi:membrane associated rhomboid family serine protease
MGIWSGDKPVFKPWGQQLTMPPLEAFGHFSILKGVDDWQIWRVVTFQFLHGNLMHLAVNMLALYVFGPVVEDFYGRWRFLWFYLFCGIGGALGYTLLCEANVLHYPSWQPLVGASAGLFGVMIAAAMLAPDERIITLPFFLPIRLQTWAIVLIGVAVYTIMTQGSNAGGEAGHLGGAALGYFLWKYPQWFVLVDWMSPTQVKLRSHQGAWERKLQAEQAQQDEVDRILEKLHDTGMESLSDAEKQTLYRASGRRK